MKNIENISIEKTLQLYPTTELKIFTSGGGLRICSIKGENVYFYGEGPTLETSLCLLTEDILAGGLEYAEVYGVKTTHYLTGSKVCDSKLEELILHGHKAKFYAKDSKICLDFEYHYRIQNNTVGELVKKKHDSIEWFSHGNTYITGPVVNGYSTKILQRVTPEDYRYTTIQTFEGENIKELILKTEGFLTAIKLINDRI